MKISVDRKENAEGELIFIITVTKPHAAPFPEIEMQTLLNIDKFTDEMSKTLDPTSTLYQDILNANHKVKEKVFRKVLTNLKFTIENDLRPKFRPICQEIYNWIYDKQESYLKTWMSEFDPQRTKYYFDNDNKMLNQQSENDFEVDIDDEDEE